MKIFLLSALMGMAAVSTVGSAPATLVIHADQPGPVLARHIQGQFAEHLGGCVYGGIWVGEDSPIPNTRGMRNDVIAALKNLKVPVVRWPGGCFADEYHWKDGIGPREKRPSLVNTHWGGVTENNHFGTHEFLDFCELIGTEPYISGNLGSGSIQEMREWVEYMTSDADAPMPNLRRQNGRKDPWKIKWFGVGNENWGCGGSMTPDYYANEYRRYQTFLKDFGDNKLFKIACGASGDDFRWTDVMMGAAAKKMHGLSLHYYTVPRGDWKQKGSATEFDVPQYLTSMQKGLGMRALVEKHKAIMDKHDPGKKVALMVDEWGVWTQVEPGTNPGFLFQQNSMRDALVASTTLDIFHDHADRIRMSNIAQMINVLQAMILTRDEKMVLTPTYHAFEMYRVHQDATSIPLELKAPRLAVGEDSIPGLSASASRASDGAIHLSISNLDPIASTAITCTLKGIKATLAGGRVLTAPAVNTINTFENPDQVKPVPFNDCSLDGDQLSITVPSKAIVTLRLQPIP